jgi:hypothetical protein
MDITGNAAVPNPTKFFGASKQKQMTNTVTYIPLYAANSYPLFFNPPKMLSTDNVTAS